MIRNRYGRWVQHHELYPLLGLVRGQHLPADGFQKSLFTPNGREVVYLCEAAEYTTGHRIKFLCDCDRWIPFGRAGQHLSTCEPYKLREIELTAVKSNA